MGDAIGLLVAIIVGAFGAGVAVVLFLLLIPEKVEKWVALLWQLADRLGILARRAHKQYVKHDLQGHVNDFLVKKTKEIPGLAAKGVRLTWVDSATTRESFLKGDQVVVRLRRSDSNDQNFVRATCIFVSTSLVHKAKRYLSPSQAEATDLYVSMGIFKEEKPELVDHFLDDYLHQQAGEGNEKVRSYIDSYSLIDEGGFFFPVYLQELHHLGEKVFGGPRSGKINVEVDELVQYLELLAQRKVGDETVPLRFTKEYCKFAIVIVGKRQVMESRGIDVYVNFVRSEIAGSSIETLYLVGPPENEAAMRAICAEIAADFDVVLTRKIGRTLRTETGPIQSSAYLAVLRSKSRILFEPSKRVGTSL